MTRKRHVLVVVLALAALAAVPAPGALGGSDDVIDRYRAYTGEEPTGSVRVALSSASTWPGSSPGPTTGEIWTRCYIILGQACALNDITGTANVNGDCPQLPDESPVRSFIAPPSVIEVGEGSHVTAKPPSEVGTHTHGTLVGMTCAYDVPGLFQLTQTIGAAQFR